jgi:hypothetical protein
MSTCVGYDLYYRFANGSCGTYDTFIESNSSSCGYVAPTPTPTPTPLPDGVLSFGSTDGGFIQCGAGYDSNDYEYYRTYEVIFTSARNTMGYVVVYLSDNSSIQIPFNENDTSASTTIFCGCGSSCADIQYVMNIIYTTPTPTPTAEPTFTPTPTPEGGGGQDPLEPI